MATAAAQPRPSVSVVNRLPGRRFDHLFFATTSWLMLAVVIGGFAPTYFLAGMLRAPLPSVAVHVHGAVFTLWMLLLVTQTSLVSAGRVDIHRRLGIAGFLLACLMVVVGTWAATDSLVRRAGPPGRDALAFYIVPLSDMLIFAVFVWYAYRDRRDSPSHKRLIYIATVSLLIAAIARFHWSFLHRRVFVDGLVSDVFLLFLWAYDFYALRKLHRSTVWASIFFLIIQQLRFPIAKTAAWHSFANWVLVHAR